MSQRPDYVPGSNDHEDVFEHDAEAIPQTERWQMVPVAVGAGGHSQLNIHDDHSGTPADKERVQRARGGKRRCEFTATQPLPRDCVPPEEHWYAGRKVVLYYAGEVPDELLGICFNILYTGVLGYTSVEYNAEHIEVEILEK